VFLFHTLQNHPVILTISFGSVRICHFMNNINFLHIHSTDFKSSPTQNAVKEMGAVDKIYNFSTKLAKTFFVASIILLLTLFGPSIWYSLNGSGDLADIIARKFENKTPSVLAPVKETYQPRFDASLPRGSYIKITSIGVDSPIYEGTYESYEETLKKGIWRTPDFNTPLNRESPTILAAHRFGYLAWTNKFRKENSFFNLPKLKDGDTIEIVWRQRKYVYEVYDFSKGEEIKDYSADLILYTCENLNSSVRIFKYARLLEI